MAELKPYHGAFDPSMKFADMHVHSDRSDGIWSIRKYLYEAEKKGLSGIVFTDHDDVTSGFDGREIASKEGLKIEVIPGVEISSTGGHMLAYFPQNSGVDNIPIGMSIPKTAEYILNMGGVVGFPHPDYKSTSSVNFQDILNLANLGIKPAVELFNSGVRDTDLLTRFRGRPCSNETTRIQYEKHKEILGIATGGTDSHFRTVGRGLMGYSNSLESAFQTSNSIVVFEASWERLLPWDPFIHQMRLHRMEKKRENKYSPFSEDKLILSPAD